MRALQTLLRHQHAPQCGDLFALLLDDARQLGHCDLAELADDAVPLVQQHRVACLDDARKGDGKLATDIESWLANQD